jgi:putative ABC transport system permease protein
MLKNYLTVAFRNLWRHRGFSAINILGLTVGMTAFFLIFLYVRFELSYDDMHSKADRIYRIVCDIKTPTETIPASGPAWAVAPHLMGQFPELETSVRVADQSFLVTKGDIKFQEDHSEIVDSDFFKVFDFPLISGNPNTVLREPFSLVISESAAKKYFGNTNPVGKTLLVTGIPRSRRT